MAVLTLQSTEGFSGMGFQNLLGVWRAFCLGDVFEQIYSAILTLAKDKKKALETMKLIGIKELANRPMGKLSGGQQQKVMLARAFAKNPKMHFIYRIWKIICELF